MPETLRLIVDGPVDGAANMARDRAIQLAVEAGESPSTLRLYRWVRPTVSLGRFQPTDQVDLELAHAHHVDVVRRFTGGRGVLHDDELTYAIIAAVTHGVPEGIAASYRFFSAALVSAYGDLGIDAAVSEHGHEHARSGACFLASTRADLSVGSRKLAGSAQVWHGATVLQHGSLPASRDIELEAALFRLDSARRDALERSATSMTALTGTAQGIESMGDVLAARFSELLGRELLPGELSASECDLALELEPGCSVQRAVPPAASQ